MWQRRIGCGVICALCLLAVILILPAVQQAREAARRTQSKNNLRQIGMALSGYHELHRCFPPGGTFDSNGHGQHGWTTFLWCYMEATPYYGMLDFNQPWDAPANAGFFQHRAWGVRNPSIDVAVPEKGFAVSHYSANSNLLGANSFVTQAEIQDQSNTFLAGELGGDFVPWGCPYNWRPLIGLTNTPRTYGRLENYGGQFLMVDGSVRWIAPELSKGILASLNGPDLSRAAREKLEIVRPASFPFPPEALIPGGVTMDEKLSCFGMRDKRGELIELRLVWGKFERSPEDADLKRLEKYSHLTKLLAHGTFSDAGASSLGALSELEELRLSSKDISDSGMRFLGRMPQLRKLSLSRQTITSELVKILESLAKLDDLNLAVFDLSENISELLRPLSRLKNLELDLYSDKITDQSLQFVTQVGGLDELRISSDQVTDDGIMQLAELHDLSKLWISGKQITAAGVDRLRERLPKCQIR